MSTAFLKNYRQSPRKVRLLADVIRGKKAEDAVTILAFTPKRAAKVFKKVLESAIANAKHNHGLEISSLFVKEVAVNEGTTLKRWRARARGSAATIRKRTSHIKIVLGEKGSSDKVIVEEKTAKEEKAPKKEAVKKVAKTSDKKAVKKPTKTKTTNK